MRHIIRWTIWQRRISTVWWCFAVAFFLLINLVFYPSFKDSAAELEKSFENLSDAALQFFGGSTDFFSPVGFLNTQIYLIMLPIILGILAIGLGAGLVAREEQDKTIEAILARPISRSKFLLAKAISGSAIIILVSVVSFIVVSVMTKVVDIDISISSVAATSAVCTLMCLCFGAIAFCITASGRARGAAAIGVTSAVALGGYIIESLSSTVSWLSTPSKILPFHYYQSELLLRGTYNWSNVWYFIAVIVVCACISWRLFVHRDLE